MMDRLLIRSRVNLTKLNPSIRKYCSDSKKWNVVFFGTDTFALKSLQHLHRAMEGGKAVNRLSVVVPTPKPINRSSPVGKYAKANNIPLDMWPLSKEFPDGEENLELGVVASFGHLIPQRIIKAFPAGILNIHGSLLPKYRGAAPITHAILNDDEETGITIMRIKPFRFDVGDIVLQEAVPIDPQATVVQLTEQLAVIGADSLLKCVSNLNFYLDRCVPQPKEGVSLAPKIDDPGLARLDWSTSTASELYNRWRAVQHLFKFLTAFHGDSIRLDAMEPPVDQLPDTINLQRNFSAGEEPEKAGPGRVVVDRKKNVLLVRCRQHWAVFRLVSVNKKAPMSSMDFANGFLYKKPYEEHFFSLPKS